MEKMRYYNIEIRNKDKTNRCRSVGRTPVDALEKYFKSIGLEITRIVKLNANNRTKANICIYFDKKHCNFYYVEYKYSIKKKEYMRIKKESRLIENKNNKNIRDSILNIAEKEFLLYHGSDGGIKGEIRCDASDNVCDFGVGFYTGDNIKQAENRVVNKKDGIVYAFKANLSDIDIYEFKDAVMWALFVGYNRNMITDVHKYSKLIRQIKEIEKHDVIVGLIADDKIARSYSSFMAGDITDKCLEECLSLVKYGRQFVFKNEEIARNNLVEVGRYRLTPEMRKESLDWGRETRGNIDADIDSIRNRYRREQSGKYIDEYLGEYE